MTDGIITPQNMILLFDETGTPSFGLEVERQHFIGVSTLYAEDDENSIFDACGGLIGLSKTSPKKNCSISTSTAIKIAKILSDLPITIYVRYLDLTNESLRNAVDSYNKLGNRIRLGIRSKEEPEIKERKISHLLHSHILNFSFFEQITDLDRNKDTLFSIKPFIDDWSVPKRDRDIYLKGRSASLQKRVNEFYCNTQNPGHVSVSDIITLDNSSPSNLTHRKRFVDSITSVVSRFSIFSEENTTDNDPYAILASGLIDNFSCRNVTDEITTLSQL